MITPRYRNPNHVMLLPRLDPGQSRMGVCAPRPRLSCSDISRCIMRAEKGAASPKGRGLCALATPDLIRGSLGAEGEGMRPHRNSRIPSPFRPKRLDGFAVCDPKAGSPLPMGEVVAPLPAPEKPARRVNTRACVGEGFERPGRGPLCSDGGS
jgi:hypothetical protein